MTFYLNTTYNMKREIILIFFQELSEQTLILFYVFLCNRWKSMLTFIF